MSSILLWNPSVIPLLRVNRHMTTISSDQEFRVSPSCTNCARPAWRSWYTARRKRGADYFAVRREIVEAPAGRCHNPARGRDAAIQSVNF